MAEQMVAKYLAKHCPSTHQLEAFFASRSQELLINNVRMLACVQAIHKSKVDVGSRAVGLARTEQDPADRWLAQANLPTETGRNGNGASVGLGFTMGRRDRAEWASWPFGPGVQNMRERGRISPRHFLFCQALYIKR